jgi:hypothetical protein
MIDGNLISIVALAQVLKVGHFRSKWDIASPGKITQARVSFPVQQASKVGHLFSKWDNLERRA